VKANGWNINSYSSFINSAPLIDNQNNFIWNGGYNKFYTPAIYPQFGSEVLDLNSSYIHTDRGNNDFTVGDQSIYHIWGTFPDTVSVYYANGNCWYGNNGKPNIYLVNVHGQIPFQWDELGDCDAIYPQILTLVEDKGNGVFDSIKITSSNNTIGTSDAKLMGETIKYQIEKNYDGAINNCKNIIDNYLSSNFTIKALFGIYENTLNKDTTGNLQQSIILFTDIKNYLENKLVQYQSNTDFSEITCELILMCLIKIHQFVLARDGYEYIAENNPNLEKRIIASWNYILVNQMIQGNGGGFRIAVNENENVSQLKEVLKKIYDKKNRDIERTNNELISKYGKEIADSKINIVNDQNNKLKSIATYNIITGKQLTKTEINKKIDEDFNNMYKLNGTDDFKASKINGKENALQYKLSQNYPNPFNPITNIDYNISNNGLTTIIVYNVLGKEVATLVNEYKVKGSYKIAFDATSLSSGIYFYKIVSGNFMEVKKMILIK